MTEVSLTVVLDFEVSAPSLRVPVVLPFWAKATSAVAGRNPKTLKLPEVGSSARSAVNLPVARVSLASIEPETGSELFSFLMVVVPSRVYP
ncbi:hypothetical protein DPM19_20235 [Actinomadura craniellae]|uniref:Uncharacterized protein n=1 Tax=Actinomadura craniellae TaxID=2231787 RepID=A0A365H2S2_9ACTN|nr:hypothetical protein DPM19_20235 [Actinomadura craniellae]